MLCACDVIWSQSAMYVLSEIGVKSARWPDAETRGRSAAEVWHRASQSTAAADTLLVAVADGLRRRWVPRVDEDTACRWTTGCRHSHLASGPTASSAEDLSEWLGWGRDWVLDARMHKFHRKMLNNAYFFSALCSDFRCTRQRLWAYFPVI